MASEKQITDDLRKTFRGRLAFAPLARGLYSTDASPFQVMPLGVAIPADAEDLALLVNYCFSRGIALAPRGAGTGVAGESLSPGLIVDLSTNFHRIIEVTDDSATVEPGVVLAELNAVLGKRGRRFAPDPASAASCTMGGMIATNASGANAFRHGFTRDYVTGLNVVWDSGAADVVGNGEPSNPRTAAIRDATAALLEPNRQLIEETRPKTPFNRCGYQLHDVMPGGRLDIAKLLVGSEGTLGFITAATLRTIPLPGGVCAVLLGFGSLDAALQAALDLRAVSPTSGDLLDRRLLASMRTAAAVAAALLVTFEADSEREAKEMAETAVEKLRTAHRLVVLEEPVCDPDGLARIRGARQAAVSGLYGLGKGPRPLAFIEDVGVPAEQLPTFIERTQDALKTFELSASFLIHAFTGQVHARPMVDLDNPVDRDKLWPLAEAVHGIALELGGTVSAQHGT
ncbi:MAG TPA: FAD-binding oxidoreductase, partial [Gemmataceae bacterium]